MSYKFQRLREKLREAIRGGEFDGKLPGERALARRFHVNAKTLSKALTDLAAEGLLDRSIGRGTFVKGSAPQAPARGRWLVLCDAGDTGGNAQCLLRCLGSINEQLEVCSVAAETGRLRPSFVNQFDAVIDLSCNTPETVVRDMAVRSVPVISVRREPRTYSTHAVLVDLPLAADRIARDLALAGHRRLLTVESPGNNMIAQALRQTCARYAATPNPAPISVETAGPRDLAEVLTPGALGGDGGATAIVCDSVDSAKNVRQILQDNGVSMPRDVCLLAIGMACNNAPDASKESSESACGVPCSGYFVSCHKLADSIADLLRDPPLRPATLWLVGEWVDGGTTTQRPIEHDTDALRGPVSRYAQDVAAPSLAPLGLIRGSALTI